MKRHSGKLRIIGGKHKGRKVTFTEANGLRPTAERLRETLFNWLMLNIEGSICLDLFAGSGALGLEALSRGAAEVTFVESNRKTADTLAQTVTRLKLSNSLVVCQNAIEYLANAEQPFDIIFLDPPYKSNLLQKSIDALEQHNSLKAESIVYFEYAAHEQPPTTPNYWNLHRSAQAGDAKTCLYRIHGSS